MTWENELGELVGRPARESELERHSIANTGSTNPVVGNSSQNPVNLETPTIQPNPASDPSENPASDPAENPTSDPSENPVSDPSENPVPSGNPASDHAMDPAPLPFAELRKLRKPGKGVQMTRYKDIWYRTYWKGDEFWGRIASEKDLNIWKEKQAQDEIARAAAAVEE
jgi:hypothetical protein